MQSDWHRTGVPIGTLLLLILLVISTLAPLSSSLPIAGRIENMEHVTLNEDSAVFTWNTLFNTDTKIEYGKTQSMTESEEKSENVRTHYIEIDDLSANTKYYYRIGSGNTWTDTDSFTTLKKPDGELLFTFIMAADPHYSIDGQNNQAGSMDGDSVDIFNSFIDDVNEMTDIEFMLIKGDLTSGASNDYKEFENDISTCKRAYYLALGNSDKSYSDWEQLYSNAFEKDETYFSFEKEGWHFVVLDTARYHSDGTEQLGGYIDKEQLDWLEEDLNATDGKPTMIFGHHQADTDEEIWGLVEDGNMEEFQRILAMHPTVLSYNNGHNHRNEVTTETATDEMKYVSTAALVEYPIGYTQVNVYRGGYTQTFRKLLSQLDASETSRDRQDDPDRSLGDLDERSFTLTFTPNEDDINKIPKAFIESINPNPAFVNTTVEFKGRGEDIDGTIVSYDWTSSIDGFLNNEREFNMSLLSLGVHYIRLKVQDDRFAWSGVVSTTLEIIENGSDADTEPPTVNITSPVQDEVFTSTYILIEGTATDNSDVYLVEVSLDGVSWIRAEGTTNWTAYLTLDDGGNTVYARAKDLMGNIGDTSITVSVDEKETQPEENDLLTPGFESSALIAAFCVVALGLALGNRKKPSS